ncbi:hypothetical protein HPB49_005478 [Dermacentor silvarum]|uniref:Uncharacterized protein n=1 Tax=Dermacentor silvarum TaxID=543639 RepID=A0ACB8DVV7_DERSI|nr:uncharacterized protein LOC125942356 [Dermacentor silvarum]KAH7978416.1 hypothetical protein HPB49_005478 [Dermacentor silvarum]
MSVSLPANSTALDLHELLRGIGPETVHELDITNCLVADQNHLYTYIGSCSNLRSLRCLACPILASNLLWLLQERLVHLEELEFSLSFTRSETDKEIMRVNERSLQFPLTVARSLHRVYAEVSGEDNAGLLRGLLAFCPNVTDLHLHVVGGNFRLCLIQAQNILNPDPWLHTFTFSSGIPPKLRYEPCTMTLFCRLSLVCANVSYCDGVYNCVWLRDLALDPDCRELASQLVVIVTHDADVLAQRIAAAARRHIWTGVRCLTLALLPRQPLSAQPHPIAESVYLGGLREFFPVLKYLVELNVSSFHFGPDVDFTQLLQDAGLAFLQALSTAPCAFSQPDAVRRLADVCRELVDLDVRVEKRGRFSGCTVCQLEFRLNTGDMAALHDGYPRSRRRLVRLTLSGVPRLESLRFLECCEVDELRLVDCPDPSHPHFVDIGELLARNAKLISLLIRNTELPFGTTGLLANVTRVTWLQFLCLLSEVPVLDDIATAHVEQLTAGLTQLKCLHIHYRSKGNGREQLITWLWRSAEGGGDGHLIRNGPCILCCTATFIGLAKPLNRGY